MYHYLILLVSVLTNFNVPLYIQQKDRLVGWLPALYHDVVDVPRAAGGRGETETTVNFTDHFTICVSLKWLVPETPYLVHHTTKAPHIT